jgi:hypothetical protein
MYGSESGLTTSGAQFFIQGFAGMLDAVETGDAFGSTLNWGDFNDDGYGDLAVGVENENIGDIDSAGAVHIIYGSEAGLTATGNQFWHQDTAGIPDNPEQRDLFGAALAAGDFNNDGVDDLAIGVEFEDVGSIAASGAVHVLYGAFGSGLTDAFNQFWHQDTAGILGTAENSDAFGSALAAGDFNGDGRDDLAIGVPFENVADLTFAGAVNVIYGTSIGLRASVTISGQTLLTNQFWTENNANFNGAAEDFDRFGSSLSAWNFGKGAPVDLAIGIPLEDVGSIQNAGAVLVLYGRPLTSGSVSVEGLATTGRQVGRRIVLIF